MIPFPAQLPSFFRNLPLLFIYSLLLAQTVGIYFFMFFQWRDRNQFYFQIVSRKIGSCFSLFWKNFFMTLWNTCYYKVRRTTALTLKKKTSESKDKKMTNDIISHSLEVRRSVFLKLWIPHGLNFIFKYRGGCEVR